MRQRSAPQSYLCFFLVTSQPGVKSMTLSVDGARECVVRPNHVIVQCASAMWTYRYHNEYTVTLHGAFTAHVIAIPNAIQNGLSMQSALHSSFTLKIDQIQFDCSLYEKHISVDQIGNIPTPSPTVNGAGVLPQPPSQLPSPSRVGQRDDERWEEPWITSKCAFIPEEPVNFFRIPHATMRCLEVRPPNKAS